MNGLHFEKVGVASLHLFNVSQGLFWSYLPVAFLLAILMIYISGDISGGKFESLFRRLIIAIMLLVAFPTISSAIQGVESQLLAAFGGDQSISDIFGKVADKAKDIKNVGGFSWIKVGESVLALIATLSFLLLAVIQHFLNVLHVTIWNLLHILGPLALLACLFPSMSNIPKGIFSGMLELALWKPMWAILAQLLIAIGFGEQPADPEHWFDTMIMNFAVAGLMASTPALVHGFMSGSLASVGGSTIQTMLSGTGALLTRAPMNAIQSTARTIKGQTLGRVSKAISKRFRPKSKTKPKLAARAHHASASS